MRSYTIKYPSMTLGNPAARPGWLYNVPGKRRVAHLLIVNVPDDVPLDRVMLVVNNTITTMGLDDDSTPKDWTFDWSEFSGKPGQIIHHRKRADLHDTVQETCIKQMDALGLNPNRVAELVGDAISRTHVCDYLSRRSSLGSHKLQHLLPVLKLALTVANPLTRHAPLPDSRT